MLEMISNPAHVHMWLNHVPTVGFGVALALFVFAWLKGHADLTRTGLVMFFVVAVVAIAAFLSATAAEAVIQGRADVAPAAVRAHEDAALLAFVLMEATGFFAWL